jgi:protein-tyrosine-phosphatase
MRPIDEVRAVVICRANQCRSPLGEAILRRELASEHSTTGAVSSAGLHAYPGAAASDGSVLIARKMRLDLSDHSSSPITPEILEWGNLFLCMEPVQVMDLCQRYEAPLESSFAVLELAERASVRADRPAQSMQEWLEHVGQERSGLDLLQHSRDWSIADPVGKSMRHYKRMAATLETALQQIARSLAQTGPS